MGNQLKIVGFATAVCLVCSILLACVTAALKDRQEANRSADIKTKVLAVFGEAVVDEKGRRLVTDEELNQRFATRITGMVLDGEGNAVSNISVEQLEPEQINERDSATGLKAYYPLYEYCDPESNARQYAIHVSGKGLWSTVKGYMAFGADLATISALTFYEHQETPGLGGEIEKPYFLDRFKGKKMYEAGKPTEFKIVKAGDDASSSAVVDGISGATMTCRGVSMFLKDDFEVYNRYFDKKGLRP